MKTEIGKRGVCEAQSDGSLGWTIREIRSVRPTRDGGVSVELNDGISFSSACFVGAEVGDIWAVCHEHLSPFCLGQVRRAIRLEPASSFR